MITATDKKNIKEEAAKPAAVARNLSWMAWSGAVSVANSVLVWMFLARMRDVEEMGRFTIVMGLYALFFNVCSLGLVPYLVNEISRRDESEKLSASTEKKRQPIIDFISSASVLLLISGVACAVLMTMCGFLVSESWSVRLSTLVLSLALIPSGVIGVAESAAVSFGRARLIALVTTMENVLRTVIPIALIWFGFDIFVICASFAAIRITALLPYLWTARKDLPRFAFNAADFRKILKVAPTFGGTVILASINWQAVIILLAFYSTEIESAKYGVASRFLIPVTILMASYANVIQPIIARYTQNSVENAGSYLSKMLSYPLILSTVAAIVSPFLSHFVLTAFFGESYGAASETLDFLAMSVIPFCLVMIVSRGLVATGAQHVDLLANALGVVACLSLGSVLIPRYGAVGAAQAQLCAFLVMALVEGGYLSRKIISFRVRQAACLTIVSIILIHLIIWK